MSTSATTTTATIAALDDPPSLPAPLLPLLRPSASVSVSALSVLLPGARVGAELAGAYLKTGFGRTTDWMHQSAPTKHGRQMGHTYQRSGDDIACQPRRNQRDAVRNGQLMSTSLYVGYTVGCAVGAELTGENVGYVVGRAVGAAVGAVVGAELVGTRVGVGVGAEVVGAAEGPWVRMHSV